MAEGQWIRYNIAYKKRICDALLADELAGAGAVLIEGAKWCGKAAMAGGCDFNSLKNR